MSGFVYKGHLALPTSSAIAILRFFQKVRNRPRNSCRVSTFSTTEQAHMSKLLDAWCSKRWHADYQSYATGTAATPTGSLVERTAFSFQPMTKLAKSLTSSLRIHRCADL